MINTDYSKVNALFLTYPENFETEYHELAPFFEELISLCPNDIIYFIIVNNSNSAKYIKNRFKEKDIRPIVVSDFYEVWLRDIMGFACTDRIIKPRFQPDYCKDKYSKEYVDLVNQQTKYIIRKSINVPIQEIDLVWDGGNFGTNGTICFVTEKILKDNPNKDINTIVKNTMNLDLVLIPQNIYDTMGHTDGYIAVISNEEVFLPKYPDLKFLAHDIAYSKLLKNIVESKGMKVNYLFDRPVDESKNELYSLRGNFINHLNINRTVILPKYKLPYYKRQEDYNSSNFEIIKMYSKVTKQINCDQLVNEGGGLHCISWISKKIC